VQTHDKYKIEVGKDSEHVIQFLEDKIYEHNSSEINKSDGEFFSRIIRDESERIIAGIAGWTWAGACEITQFWVDEKARNNGIGKLLLGAAETEAKGKGCIIILIKSYSFQAPHFYERHGYKIEHVLSDFPPGHDYYMLSKRIG
jgi:GNAT superfamily N-acetyltransferase